MKTVRTAPKFQAPGLRLSIGNAEVTWRDPEDGWLRGRTVYFVVARGEDSERFWPDYIHAHTFECRAAAEAFLARIEAALGDGDARIPAARLATSPHWTRDTRPDPLESLKPFGEEWHREQEERAGY